MPMPRRRHLAIDLLGPGRTAGQDDFAQRDRKGDSRELSGDRFDLLLVDERHDCRGL
jgi:hypothetical protein